MNPFEESYKLKFFPLVDPMTAISLDFAMGEYNLNASKTILLLNQIVKEEVSQQTIKQFLTELNITAPETNVTIELVDKIDTPADIITTTTSCTTSKVTTIISSTTSTTTIPKREKIISTLRSTTNINKNKSTTSLPISKPSLKKDERRKNGKPLNYREYFKSFFG